jgi:uncharacterized protein
MIYADEKFEWDTEKAGVNAAKHGVTFDEARGAFDDPHGVEVFDEEHSIDEARYQLIGLSARRLLFVVFTERGERKRLIHARKATKAMEQFYVEQNS